MVHEREALPAAEPAVQVGPAANDAAPQIFSRVQVGDEVVLLQTPREISPKSEYLRVRGFLREEAASGALCAIQAIDIRGAGRALASLSRELGLDFELDEDSQGLEPPAVRDHFVLIAADVSSMAASAVRRGVSLRNLGRVSRVAFRGRGSVARPSAKPARQGSERWVWIAALSLCAITWLGAATGLARWIGHGLG